MKTLLLNDDQFESLFAYLQEVVEYLEGEMETTEDENGNEIIEDINEYEIYQIFQQLKNIRGKS